MGSRVHNAGARSWGIVDKLRKGWKESGQREEGQKHGKLRSLDQCLNYTCQIILWQWMELTANLQSFQQLQFSSTNFKSWLLKVHHRDAEL